MSDDLFMRTTAGPSPEGRGITIDDFVAYLPSHVYIFTPCREVWTGVSVNSSVGARCRRSPEPASRRRTRTVTRSTSPPLLGSTAIAR